MADTGWIAAGVVINIQRSSGEDWSNPSNATADDGSYATSDIPKAFGMTDWLRADDFDFASEIPAGATLDVIEARIQRKAEEAGKIRDYEVYLHIASTSKGDDYSESDYYPTSDENKDYGGASDTWNSGLDMDDIKNEDFGVKLSCMNTSLDNDRYVYVDCIWMKIYYTEAGAVFIPRITGII